MRSESEFQDLHADPPEAARHNVPEPMPGLPDDNADSAAGSADKSDGTRE